MARNMAKAASFSSLALISSTASNHLLQSCVSLQLIFITSLLSFESGQAQFLVDFFFLINAS